MNSKCIVLGSGASLGVPVVGCHCPVCTSSNLRNHRLRSAILLQIAGFNLLVDVSVDFRQMALMRKIHSIDGLLITHYHQDHVGGIDDLRPLTFQQSKMIPLLASRETYEELDLRFQYFMKWFDSKILEEENGTTSFLDIPLTYISYTQKDVKVTGFRFGNFAYVTDIKTYDNSIFSYLEGVDTLILGAIQRGGTHMHFSFEEADHFRQKVGAKKTYLTHLSHLVDHELDSKELPEGMDLAFDGLELRFHV